MHEDMGKVLGVDGPGCYQLEACGRTWSFGMPTQADKAEFVGWCRQRLLAEVGQLKADAPEQYREALTATLAELASGEYRWGLYPRAGCLRLMQSEEGVLKLLELALRHRQPWATADDLLALVEADPQGVRDALRECLTVPPSLSPAGSPTAPGTASR